MDTKSPFELSLGKIACQHSFTRLLGFHFLYKTPLDVARSSQLLQSSNASPTIGLPPWRSSSFQKYNANFLKIMRYRSSTPILILIAESARCCFASSLSDRVHEIRFFTLIVINISSGVTTAQWFRSIKVFSRELKGVDRNLVRFLEYIQLKCSKRLEKSSRDKLQRSSTLIGHQQLPF